MPHNALVTGPPRSGKTTAVERTIERLAEDGLRDGGVVAPELREGSNRVGFEIRDLLSGESRIMAHVDRETGPSVGKYRVDVGAVDEISAEALAEAREDADYVVVDEIAPMEVVSDAFVEGVRRALDGDQPLLATVHYRSQSGFIGEVKERDDVELFEVTTETRDDLPETLAELVVAWLDGP